MSMQNRVSRSIAFRCSAALLAALQVFAVPVNGPSIGDLTDLFDFKQ